MTDYLPTSGETHPFLVRDWEGKLFQAPRLFVKWHDVTRTKRIVEGLFREVEHDHWDHTQLNVLAANPRRDSDDAHVIAALGVRAHNSFNGKTVPNSNDGVKQVVRRITPEDAAEIEQVDNDILELQREIAELRTQRKELVSAAWRRGKQVAVHDLRPSRDDDPPSKYFPDDAVTPDP